MPNQYHTTISQLEAQNVAADYILGWASGYLGNPEIEEQRMTDGWRAGYDDGKEKNTDNADNFKA